MGIAIFKFAKRLGRAKTTRIVDADGSGSREKQWVRAGASLVVLTLITSVAALAVATDAQQADRAAIGAAIQVSGDVEISGDDHPMRTLVVGDYVHFGEKIVTGPQSSAVLEFEDGTALTITPNSTVDIDTFVFDPDSQPDRSAISAIKGFFRLLGGPLENADEAPASDAPAGNPPVGAAGVRG
ncbi:MAG: hypothetical protein AAFR28_10940 [Pseudomonadota bacterium]